MAPSFARDADLLSRCGRVPLAVKPPSELTDAGAQHMLDRLRGLVFGLEPGIHVGGVLELEAAEGEAHGLPFEMRKAPLFATAP